MPVTDVKITEVMYNPAGGTDSEFEYVEITNSGSDIFNISNWQLGNSDFLPEVFFSLPDGAIFLTAGQVAIIAPNGTSQAAFEALYGPLPEGTVYINATGTLGLSNGGQPLTLISGFDGPADSISYPDIANGVIGAELSVGVTRDEFGNPVYTTQSPNPGLSTVTEPEPPVVNEIEGTELPDDLTGTAADDIINGGAGGDTITGANGNDTIDGGAQSDIISGNQGDDEIYGGLGHDTINGGNGEDLIYGGSNDDWINGGADNDEIFGDHGKDRLNGGAGDDDIYGGKSNDRLFGGLGEDELYGGSGNDRLDGGDDADILDGGGQRDVLFGVNGDDIIIGGKGNDRMTGGAGADTFVFSGVTNNDRILDFEVGVDKIDLFDLGPLTLGVDVTIEQTGGNVRIELLGSNTLILQGVNLENLSESDFIYFEDIFTVG